MKTLLLMGYQDVAIDDDVIEQEELSGSLVSFPASLLQAAFSNKNPSGNGQRLTRCSKTLFNQCNPFGIGLCIN